MTRRRAFAVALCVLAGGCGDGEGPTAPDGGAAASAGPAAEVASREPAPRARPAGSDGAALPQGRSPLLRDDDVGGWTPSAEDCAFAQRLGDPALREATLAAIAGASAPDRVRWLRAAIRLRDPAAARRAATWPGLRASWLDTEERRLVSGLILDAALAGERPHGAEAGLRAVPELTVLEDVDRFLAWYSAASAEVAVAVDPSDFTELVRPDDVPLLGKLAADGDSARAAFAIRGLESLSWDDDTALAALRAVAPRIDRDADLAARLRPRRADDARQPLRGRAPAPGERRAPPERAAILAALTERGPALWAILEECRKAHGVPGRWAAREAEPWSVGLDEALVASRLDWYEFGAAAVAIPGCRTRAAAEELVRRMPPGPGPLELTNGRDDRSLDPLAFAESAARDALVRALAARVAANPKSPDGELLALVAGPSEAETVVAWARVRRAESWGRTPWAALAEIPHPSVRAFLVAHVAGTAVDSPSLREALEAIARMDGLPPTGPWHWPGAEREREAIRDLILAKRPVDAFAAILAAHPDRVVLGEASVTDVRVRAHLDGLRTRRELDLHVAATVELAVHGGDPAARAELHAALAAGHADWLAKLRATLLPTDDVLAWMPLVLDLFERGNAPLREEARGSLDEWFGWEPATGAEARLWWERHGGEFAWSRLAGRFVPLPR